jgi:hypothetical protein
MLKTFVEKQAENIKNGIKYTDRQNTKWMEEIACKCKHTWQPLSFSFENGSIPDIARGRVYCVCMKCCSHTYIETGWVGFYLNSPDDLESEE